MEKHEAQAWLQGRVPGGQGDAAIDKATLLAAAQENTALHTLIEQYIPDEQYRSLDDALQLIPEEGWQDLQGA